MTVKRARTAAAMPPAGGGGGPSSDEPPEEGSVHRGVVKRIEHYGVFVSLDGFRRQGLVHASQARGGGGGGGRG